MSTAETSAIKAALKAANTPGLRTTDGQGTQATARVRVIGPGRFTYYVTEWDGDDDVFGYILSPLGPDCDELGYAAISEWEQVAASNPRYLIELDQHFEPVPLDTALALAAASGLSGCEQYDNPELAKAAHS